MKKAIAILLAAMCVFGASACKDNKGESGAPAPADNTAVVIGGFNSLKELKTLLYSNTFRKAEVNSVKDYVTEGGFSGKFTLGGGENGAKSKFDLWLDTEYANRKMNFTDVHALTVDVWSTSKTEREFSLSFTTRLQGAVRSTYVAKTFRLKKGYNRIIYTIDRAVAKDVCYMNNAEYVTFTFDNSGTDYFAYVDNLVAHTTDEAITEVQKTYKENELLFFDDFSDRFMISTNTLRGQPSEAPSLSVCRDPKFIKSGTGSLQVTLVVTPSRPGMDDAPGITISGDAVERVDFSKYSGVSFSVNADTESFSNVSVEFVDANGLNYNSICHLQEIYEWKQKVPGFKWHTMTADVQKMADKGLDMTKITKINIYYGNVQTGEPYSFYFDDFTLVPKGE